MAQESFGFEVVAKSKGPKELWEERMNIAAMMFVAGWVIAGVAPTFIVLKVWGFWPGLVAACLALGVLIMARQSFLFHHLWAEGRRQGYYDKS